MASFTVKADEEGRVVGLEKRLRLVVFLQDRMFVNEERITPTEQTLFTQWG